MGATGDSKKAADKKKEVDDNKLDVEEEEEEKKPDVWPEPQEVSIHSLPLLSTVDHYTRLTSNSSGKRVVGILLGHNVLGKVHCTNSFAVPFEENADAVWYFDHHYLEDMFAMFKKVNAKETIVGWYSTGPKLRPNDLEIHQVIRKYCPNPVYVIIRVNESSLAEGLPCTV